MVRDIYDMKEYIRKELEGIEDYGTIVQIFSTMLRWNGIPWTEFRTAVFVEEDRQCKLFPPPAIGKHFYHRKRRRED